MFGFDNYFNRDYFMRYYPNRKIRIMNTPDFEVKKLSEYSVEDLDVLYSAVIIASVYGNSTFKKKQILDVWSYRIKDAIKEAKQTK